MKYKHKSNEPLIRYFFCLFSLIALVFIVATSNSKNVLVASNINTVKAIESSRIKVIEKKEAKYTTVYSVEDIKNNQNNLIEFNGIIRGYALDCSECNTRLSCLENQDDLVNNIYYNDKTYGTVRILKTNESIPCGSIIKISNYDNQEFLGIVLDSTNDDQNLIVDLLFENENSILNLGLKENIDFKIERWSF